MPARRGDPDWRLVPPEATAQLSLALERFSSETRTPMKRLAAAVGLNAADLSPSHLRQRALLLFWSLRRSELPRIALALRLDLNGMRALQRLSATINEALGGFCIPAEGWEGSRKEAADVGSVGVDLFDRHAWDESASHLSHAWTVLSAAQPAPDDSDFEITLRTGTQLLHYLCYAGEARRSVAVGRTLLKLAATYRGTERPTLNALALTYRSVAVAAHHQGLDAPGSLVRWCGKAHAVLHETGLDRLGQIGALRDQAKPHLMAAVPPDGTVSDPASADAALAALDHAEALAGGRHPEESAREEWLLTRITRVQCLGVLGEAAAARKCWDDLQEREWAGGWLREREHPTAGKAALAQAAVHLAEGDLEAAGAVVHTFRSDPASQRYGDRLRRAEAIERAAAAGDAAGIRLAILR